MMTLEEAQHQVDCWIKKYGVRYFSELTNMAVLRVLLCIANQTGVNVTEAFARNLEKKTQRDNTRHINNPKLQDHGEE